MIVTDECGAGHESAGQVIEVGEGVVNLKVGDRVAIEAGVPCGQADCDPCREGEYKACTCCTLHFCSPRLVLLHRSLPLILTPLDHHADTCRPTGRLLLDPTLSRYPHPVPCAPSRMAAQAARQHVIRGGIAL